MKKFIAVLTLFTLLVVAMPTSLLAQEPLSCTDEYTVQQGDWLSKIAEKYFGDLLAYSLIVEANNADAGDNYIDIENADLIEPGWLLCIPAVAGAEAQPEGLTRADLANATYNGIYDEPVTLTDGKYEGEPFVEGGAARPTVVLVEPNIIRTAYGDVTGDGNTDAVAFLAENSGGSGVFTYIALMVNQDGQPLNVATANLGDRVSLNSAVVENNQIVIDMVQAGPDDPACCPTQHVINTYALQGDQLVQVSSEEVKDDSTMAPAVPLAGTDWQLATVNGQPALADAPVTLKFGEDGIAGGSDGCNGYSFGYETDGNSISFGAEGPSTLIFCSDEISAQTNAFKDALSSAATYSVEGDTLTLYDADGNATATFTEMVPVSLAGSWQVTGYNNGNQAVVSVIIGTEMTATFAEDGTLAGFAGCNNYNATYTAGDDGSISIGPAATTRMFCEQPEGTMDQETQYLTALQSAATYSIELDRLQLRTADGALAADFTRLADNMMESSTDGSMEAMEEATVSGQVVGPEGATIPEGSTVEIQVQDVSKADVLAETMGAVTITDATQFPIPFEVPYDAASIDERFTYAMSVRITDSAGNLIFINTTSTPVITNGNPTTDVEVVVEAID